MFFVNKSNKEEIVELIHSGDGFCIVIDQIETLASKDKNTVGKILRFSKKELKKKFRKIADGHKMVMLLPIDDTMKKQVIDTFNTDQVGILDYTEDYIENQKYLDKQEEIEKQTEGDRVRMLKELADDYNPNGISVEG